MRSRWMIGFTLFALGFGTAFLLRLPRAEGSDGWKWYEPELGVQDLPDRIAVHNASSAYSYLMMVQPKTGSDPEPPATFGEGTATVPKTGLASVTIYRLEPVALWMPPGFRPCSGPIDCVLIPPLPPLPQPQPRFLVPGGD